MVERVVAAVLPQRNAKVIALVVAQVAFFLGQRRPQHVQHVPLVRDVLRSLSPGHRRHLTRQQVSTGRKILGLCLVALVRRRQGTHRGTDGRKPIVARSLVVPTTAGSGHVEPGKERLSVPGRAGLLSRSPSTRLRRQSQNLLADQVDGLVEVLKTQRLGPFMAAGDEILDLPFVLRQERVDVLLVQHDCTLGLRKYEITEEKETNPAVEGEPIFFLAVSFGLEKNQASEILYHPRMNTVHDSASKRIDKTTQ